jgi:hypothetical protein
MKKVVLIYGLVSGVVSAILLVATIPYINSADFRKGDVLGYASIVLTVLLVFFGVRSYRENAARAGLSFGRGFAVGILITLISCGCHVVTFQMIYFKFVPDFGDRFAACMVERAKTSGGDPRKIDETAKTAQRLKQLYDKPGTNAAVAFAEAFPVGLIATILSAVILRRRESKDENSSR